MIIKEFALKTAALKSLVAFNLFFFLLLATTASSAFLGEPLGTGTAVDTDEKGKILSQNDEGASTTCSENWDARFAAGASGAVLTITTSGSDVYVGGEFTTMAGITVNGIAKWNGTSWSALGSGVNGSVSAIAVSGSDVYVGGSFSSAGGVEVRNIAKWNGTSWSSVGTGTSSSGSVRAIAISGNTLYAGGNFTSAGGVPVLNMAKWDGVSWSAVGSGSTSTVYALEATGGNIYAGGAGFFNESFRYIAKWDGSSWSGLGSQINATVLTIKSVGSDVYVGGEFTSSFGGFADGIAKWNGTSWSTLGSGMNERVNSIAADQNGNIFAGGRFTTAGAVQTSRVAKWNGSTWEALGSGVRDGNSFSVYAVGASGTDGYFGGEFLTAGCNPSLNFGRYFGTAFTASSNSTWGNTSNWNTAIIPNSGSNVVVSGGDALLASGNATVNDLQINQGRTLNIGAGGVLTVGRALILAGNVAGAGTIEVLNCDPNALKRILEHGYIQTALVRCVSGAGTFLFPVGTANGYSPVTFSNASGNGLIKVKGNQGAYSAPAVGLPTNRLARWWSITNEPGNVVTSADIRFDYREGDISAGEQIRYKAWRISGGASTFIGGTTNANLRFVSVQGVTQFSDWTLADAGDGCLFGLTPSRSLDFPAAGGSGSIAITTENDCSWTARVGETFNFNANASSLGPIPDGPLFASRTPGPPRDVTFTVSGISDVISNISISMTAQHTWLGDLEATLIAPNGTQHRLFGYTGALLDVDDYGFDTDLNGTYVFSDTAAGQFGGWWQAARNFPVMPTTTYRTTNSGGSGATDPMPPTSIMASLSGVSNLNGTWTLRVTDGANQIVGSVTGASISFESAPSWITLNSPTSATGSRLLDFSIAENATPNARSTTLRINDTPLTISQASSGVAGGSISGTVRYFFGQTPVAVPGVTLSATGSQNAFGSSASNGAFTLEGLGLGAYTVTPSKAGGATTNHISSLDASTVAQYSVGLIPLTSNQQIAADVSGDGTISALDASRIAQWSVGLTLPQGDLTGTWKFVPGSRTYSSVSGSLTDQDFIAILMGDVTGNWTAGLNAQPSPDSAQSTQGGFEPGDLAGAIGFGMYGGDPKIRGIRSTWTESSNRKLGGGLVEIPISIGEPISAIAYDAVITYDAETLEPEFDYPVSSNGTLSANFNIAVNRGEPGKLRLAAYGIAPITGDGDLIVLRFRIKDPKAKISDANLQFESLVINEQSIIRRLPSVMPSRKTERREK